MNILDQYGIREVADVTLFSIHKKKDGSGSVYYVPALYLDTLKVSTTDKTGENTWAKGGAGNGKFYYGKTIYVYYSSGTFDKDAWDFLGTDIYGNPYTTKNGIGIDANGYYFTFKANAEKPATIVIS